MSKRLIVALAGIVAIAVIAAGCGGGSDSSSSDSDSSSSLTKAEYIKQGDAVCKKGAVEIEAGLKSYAKENDINLKVKVKNPQVEELSENVIIPGINDQLDDLRALSIPSEDEELAKELLDALEKGIEKGEQEPVAFLAEGKSLTKAGDLAKEYGFKVCGQE